MNNANSSYSYEFFKGWFCSFLLFNDEFNERNKIIYQELLQHWSRQVFKSNKMMLQIMIDIDSLINAFDNDQYQLMFIHYMVNLCFQQGK